MSKMLSLFFKLSSSKTSAKKKKICFSDQSSLVWPKKFWTVSKNVFSFNFAFWPSFQKILDRHKIFFSSIKFSREIQSKKQMTLPKICPCVLKTSRASSRIRKWNAGVSNFLRTLHFWCVESNSPVPSHGLKKTEWSLLIFRLCAFYVNNFNMYNNRKKNLK